MTFDFMDMLLAADLGFVLGMALVAKIITSGGCYDGCLMRERLSVKESDQS